MIQEPTLEWKTRQDYDESIVNCREQAVALRTLPGPF